MTDPSADPDRLDPEALRERAADGADHRPRPHRPPHHLRGRPRPDRPALPADVAAGLGPGAHRQPGGAVAAARRRRAGGDAPRDRPALRRLRASARRAALAAAAGARRGPRATPPRCAAGCSTSWSAPRCDGDPAGRRRLRLRHDRPARAAARRDDADHPSAAPGPAGPHRARPPRRAAAVRAARPKSSSPAARSPWAPRPSRGRWTTSAPRTGGRCRRSTSTPPR